jgi:hypothetical protein
MNKQPRAEYGWFIKIGVKGTYPSEGRCENALRESPLMLNQKHALGCMK